MQPCGEGFECGDVADVAQAVGFHIPAAVWIWLGIGAGILLYDAIRLASGRTSFSQWNQRTGRVHKAFMVAGLISWSVVGWHVFIGFPW